MHEQNENTYKEIETIKRNQTEVLELKNIITECKILLEKDQEQTDQAKERISELENRSFEVIKSEEQQQ